MYVWFEKVAQQAEHSRDVRLTDVGSMPIFLTKASIGEVVQIL